MESHVGGAIQIIIGVVVGVVILTTLYLLFKGTVLPNVSNQINSMISYHS